MSGFSFHLLILTKTIFRTLHLFSHENTTSPQLKPLSISLITTSTKNWKAQPISSYTRNPGYAHFQTVLLPQTGNTQIRFALLYCPQTRRFQPTLGSSHRDRPAAAVVTGRSRWGGSRAALPAPAHGALCGPRQGRCCPDRPDRHRWNLQGDGRFFLYA